MSKIECPDCHGTGLTCINVVFGRSSPSDYTECTTCKGSKAVYVTYRPAPPIDNIDRMFNDL